MMRLMTFASIAVMSLAIGPASITRGDDQPTMTYQLRTYTTAPEKLDVLLERFERVNLPLFQRHGITLIGAWTPHESDEGDDRLVYLVAFPSEQAAERAWKNFISDMDWIVAFANEKKTSGEVVTGVEAVFLGPTDYSPALPPIGRGSVDSEPPANTEEVVTLQEEEERLFELRRYVASPGKIDDLHTRFREHTMELFAKHGMTNILYTVPLNAEDGADDVLLYFLAHPSYVAALNAWESFRSDSEWTKVREESQPDGVPLAAEVERWMLVPTAFSPLR